jgi:glycerophosphoryl diester phosphodiesterase
MWTNLDWLIARPVAHRGLHDEEHGVIENTPSAVQAAIAANYGIEVDVQITADGEAMVHHDDVLGRLTDGEGRLDQFTTAELKQIAFRGTVDRMMTLGDLCDLNGGRTTMLIELKSKFDGDDRLPSRVAEVLSNYRGPVAPMSFDPHQMAILEQKAPKLVRGIIASKYRPHPYWDLMPAWMRLGMGYLVTALAARPQFIAYGIADLPAAAPLFARHVLSMPLLTWAVRTPSERQRAARWADQMIFEGFRP